MLGLSFFTDKSCAKLEELVFFDLWIPDSGFWFPVPIPDSGFRFPAFRVALIKISKKTSPQRWRFSFALKQNKAKHELSFEPNTKTALL